MKTNNTKTRIMEKNNKQDTVNVSQALLGANDKGRVTYQVNGEDVNLSFQIVRSYLTRGNAAVTDAEVIQFISICKANGLNPFIGECWLVKFQGSPASMITARDAFLKRAENAPTFEGMQSGIIIIRENKVQEVEGSFFLQGDQLVGGWATVYRSDRKFPYIVKVRLSEYNKGTSTWSVMPGTMIQKVAEAQALRKAFPMSVSGLYTPEEMPDDQSNESMPKANEVKPVFAEAVPEKPQEVEVKAPEDGMLQEAVKEAENTPEPATDPAPVQEPQPQPVPLTEAPTPAEEKLPWEGNEEGLFKL